MRGRRRERERERERELERDRERERIHIISIYLSIGVSCCPNHTPGRILKGSWRGGSWEGLGGGLRRLVASKLGSHFWPAPGAIPLR